MALIPEKDKLVLTKEVVKLDMSKGSDVANTLPVGTEEVP